MKTCRIKPAFHLFLTRGGLAAVAVATSLLAQVPRPQAIAPLGQLVDVGDHKLHLRCTGQASPTVVLETGAGDFSFVWALVEPGVARFARVCSYDRAGYAWSEAGLKPRTLAQLVYELHTLLANAGIKPPYVLAGASLGGLIARVFSNTYRDEVAGMVLVDSAHESAIMMLNKKAVRFRELSQGRNIPPVQKRCEGGDCGIAEPLLVIPDAEPLAGDDPRAKLPDELRRIWPSAQAQKIYAEARQSEFAFLGEELDALYRKTQANPQPLGSKPLIVLTRDAADYPRAPDGMTIEEVNNERKRLQSELGGLSSNSRIVVVKDSRHEIHLDRPQVVTAAIRDVVEASRTGSLLK